VRWSLDRAGYVVVTAESSAAARELAESLAASVRFTTEPVAALDDDLTRHRALVTELNQADQVETLTTG
jgi:L-amino acid ligase C-terminal domain 2